MTAWKSVLGFAALLTSAVAAFGCQAIAGIEDKTLDTCDETCERCEAYCDIVDANCTGDHALYRTRGACLGTCKQLPAGDPSEPQGNTVACRVRQAELAAETDEPGQHCSSAGPGGGGLCGSDCESYCYLYPKICPDDAFPFDVCMAKCPALEDSPEFEVDAYYDTDSLECRLIHLANAATPDPPHCGHAGFRSNLHCFPPQTDPPDCGDYCRVVMVACPGNLKVYDDTDTCLAVCAALPQGLNKDQVENTAGCRHYHSYNSLLDPVTHCAHAGPGGVGHCGASGGVGNCESYCTLARAGCPTLYAAIYTSDAACQAECEDLPGAKNASATSEVNEEELYSVAIAENGLPNADPPIPPEDFRFQCRILHATRAVKLGMDDVTECPVALGVAGSSCD